MTAFLVTVAPAKADVIFTFRQAQGSLAFGTLSSTIARQLFQGGPRTFSGQTTAAVPEPASLALFGVEGLGPRPVLRRMRRRTVAP